MQRRSDLPGRFHVDHLRLRLVGHRGVREYRRQRNEQHESVNDEYGNGWRGRRRGSNRWGNFISGNGWRNLR